jgi:hypothetical protein
MKLLTNNTDYEETINIALDLSGQYNKPVIVHCYWNGSLSEKHLFSILSCYYFNVYNNKHKIVLWLENNVPNNYNTEIEKYAEIKPFSSNNSQITIDNGSFKNSIPLYSDCIRNLLLYDYGGVWFDLDCFFYEVLTRFLLIMKTKYVFINGKIKIIQIMQSTYLSNQNLKK